MVAGSRRGSTGCLLLCNMRQKKFQYFLVSQASLVGEKQVTGVIDQNQFCVRNQARDQFAIAAGNEGIGFSMDDQRRGCDLSDSSVAFPRQNGLQLCAVACD